MLAKGKRVFEGTGELEEIILQLLEGAFLE